MNEQKLPTALEGHRFEEAIRREAYCLWELDGCQDDRDIEYWLQAKEIVQRRLDENLGPPPTLAKIVIDQGSVPENLPATEHPKSPAAPPVTPTSSGLATGLPAEAMAATAN